VWWTANGGAPLYRETVRKRYREIFGTKMSRSKALQQYDDAVVRGVLQEAAGAKNPRGVGYTFSKEGVT
jgi:hypothetical protein